MDFKLSKNQTLIRNSAREFFERECPKEKTRELMKDHVGFDPNTWQKMVDLGFVGILIPETCGGMQGDFMELEVLLEEMGRTIVPGPFFETVCMCASALMAFGTEDQQSRYLPAIAEEGAIWTVALDDTGAWDIEPEIQLTIIEDENGFVLNGTKLFVPWANAADHLLVVARNGSREVRENALTALIVDNRCRGIEIEEIPTAAPCRKYAIYFNDVFVPRADCLGPIGGGITVVDGMIQEGALLRAAEMAGGARAAMDIALKYAKERVQFNKPIGSFQVVQHKFVKMLQEVDGLRQLVREATWRTAIGTPSPLLNAMAKVKANRVYHLVCVDAVRIHGAIGWTAEMDISLYLLRAKDLEHSCGGSDFHRELITREIENNQPAFLAVNG